MQVLNAQQQTQSQPSWAAGIVTDITNMSDEQVSQLASEKLVRARTQLILYKDAFFGFLLMSFEYVERRENNFMAATDGTRIFYNPDYVAAISLDEIIGLLWEEAGHVAMMHHTRRGNREPRLFNVACDQVLFNIQSEAGQFIPEYVNFDTQYAGKTAEQVYGLLAQQQQQQAEQQGSPGEGLPGISVQGQPGQQQGQPQQPPQDAQQPQDAEAGADSPQQPTGDSDAAQDAQQDASDSQDSRDSQGGASDADADEAEQGQGAGAESPSTDANADAASDTDVDTEAQDAQADSSSAGNASAADPNQRDLSHVAGIRGAVIDALSNDGSALSEAEQQQVEQEVRVKIAQAAQQANAIGKGSGFADRVIQSEFDATVPWQETLRRFFAECGLAPFDISFAAPDLGVRHMGIWLPHLETRSHAKLAIAVDTSGSISQREYDQFASELNSIIADYDPEEIHLIYCHSRVNKYEVIRRGESLEIKSDESGGTAFQPVFDFIEEENLTHQIQALVYFTDLYGDNPTEPHYPVIWASTTKGKEGPFGETVHVDLDA